MGDLVLLSTKDLKYQMVGKRTDKFTEHFVGPYKVKAIISSNAIELNLPTTVRIYLVVNVSRVRQYKSQVEGQTKEVPQPVVIEGEEEWEVEKIMNKRKVWGRDKYLVQWKECTVEENTWKSKENLKNVMELVEEFEREYCREEEEEVRQQEADEEKKCSAGNCQEDIRQNCSMDRATKSMTENIGNKWRKIGDGGRKICSLGIIGTHS